MAALGAGALLVGYFAISGEQAPPTASPVPVKDVIPEVPATSPADAAKALVLDLSQAHAVAAPVADGPRDIELNEQFESTQDCYFNQGRIESIKSSLFECEALAGIEEAAKGYKMCSEVADERKRELGELEAKAQGCKGDLGELSQDYYRATKEAAAAGDQNAQLCYIQSMFGEGFRFSPEEVRDYSSRAAAYARSAFMRGDWRIVELFEDSGSIHGGLLQRIAPPNPGMRYRMKRLLRLGATGDYAKLFDRGMAGSIAAKDPQGNPKLSPDEITASEHWAQEVYNKYFANSPTLSEAPEVCGPEAR